jgi:hypothetical protein
MRRRRKERYRAHTADVSLLEVTIMKTAIKLSNAVLVAATSLALGASAVYAADSSTTPKKDTSTTSTQSNGSMTGKEKATAVGAGGGAVAGAVVGGPVGAVVGAGVGALVGHEATDSNGHLSSSRAGDSEVKKAQAALNMKGYALAVDGRFGPNTQSAVRSFQEQNGLVASGTLDDATLNALGVKS